MLLLGIGYVALSWLLLDGRLSYWTTYTESTIEDSKARGLFVTDALTVASKGDSLEDWQSSFDIWTNKRYGIKYFGVLFHWTFEDPAWRHLHIEPKSDWVRREWFRRKLTVNDRVVDYKNGFTGGYEPCCNWVQCDVGDTITIQFHQAWQHDSILGDLTVIVE